MGSYEPPSGTDLHVLIIGAGITGALIAQGLKKVLSGTSSSDQD